MKRYEVWQHDYHRDRYLSHLTHAQLDHRFRDILLNWMILTDGNKIGLPPISEGTAFWAELWSHVLEEYKIRFGGPTPGTINPIETVDPGKPGAADAAAMVAALSARERARFTKFGKCKYLKKAWKRGRLRINPASSYSDPSLNRAIRDDELRIDACPRPSEVSVPTSMESTTDYYVYCVSTKVSPRLFQDFEADACIMFDHSERFGERFAKALEERLPGWRIMCNQVRYVDPVRDPLLPEAFFFTKHFRYSYQTEFRYVCLPPEPIERLVPLDIVLGSLRDISAYRVLADCLCDSSWCVKSPG